VYLAVATYAALTLPFEGTADAKDHLDYVYQVSIGQLPAPEGHPLFPDVSGRQFASAHPPLYYALMALLVGGMLPEHVAEATAVVRLVNIVLGAATIVVVAWFGHLLGGRYRGPLAVGMAAIAASSFTMIRFGAEVYNDMLLALLSSLALALTAHLILRRPSWWAGVAIVVVAALGLGTKSSFIVPLAVCVAALGITGLRYIRTRAWRTMWAYGAIAVLMLVGAIVVNAWFYAFNYERSGDWYRSSPKAPLLGRRHRSTVEVLLDPEFWLLIARGYVGRGLPERFSHIGTIIVVALAAVTVAVVVVLLLRRYLRLDANHVTLVAMLALQLAGTYATQLSHASGYGALNFRYFMPAVIAVSLLLAFGCVALGRWGVAALVAVSLMLGALNALTCTYYAMHMLDIPKFSPGIPLLIAMRNGLGQEPVVAAVAVAAIAGIALLALTPWLKSAPRVPAHVPTTNQE
jgi:4-amino-4-deoxy-L-arabinose transferase-like glycosyltransferase